MSPALGMHPGMAPHLQQLQAHLLRSAAAAALLPHAHPLQPPAPPPPPPHPHPHAHGLSPHSQLYAGVPPHSTASATLGPHGGGLPPKTEVRKKFYEFSILITSILITSILIFSSFQIKSCSPYS